MRIFLIPLLFSILSILKKTILLTKVCFIILAFSSFAAANNTTAPPTSEALAPARSITPLMREKFIKLGGDPKALDHLECIKSNYVDTDQSFKPKKARLWMRGRCNWRKTLKIEKKDVAVVIDYTSPSSNRRYFEINFAEQTIKPFYVSHGRNGSTNRGQSKPDANSNGVKSVPLIFSNKKGSNASSTGLFVTGHRYWGKWGASRLKRSMVLHGLERDVNDNSCDRSTVVHGNSYIKEKGARQGAKRMSSGCSMLDYNVVNERINSVRSDGHGKGGAAYFIFGPREKNLSEDYYCNKNDSVRLDN